MPSKSGVAGGLLSIIPQVGAIATFSPRLDHNGNSVRSQAMAIELGKRYNNFNIFYSDLTKKDITKKPY